MKSQLQCLALHVGRWEGVFTEFDPALHIKSQKKSLILFEEVEQGAIRQSNTYFSMDEELKGAVPAGQSWIYRDLSLGLRFFEDGSFSNGRVQLAPFSDFVTEQGFLYHDQKVRLVQQFNPAGKLSFVTTIREVRGTWSEPDPPTASMTGMIGHWQGSVTILTATDERPQIVPLELHFEQKGSRWLETMTVQGKAIGIEAEVVDHQRLYFPNFRGEMLFLPGDVNVYVPKQLPVPPAQERSFKIGLGWLPDPNVYLRLVRQYDGSGSWERVSLIQAERVK